MVFMLFFNVLSGASIFQVVYRHAARALDGRDSVLGTILVRRVFVSGQFNDW